MDKNNYLRLRKDEDGKIHINYFDGVFLGGGKFDSAEAYKDFCEERRDGWLYSKLGNYSNFRRKHRKEIASRWDKAKEYDNINLEFYFNLDSKEEIFKSEVAELAKSMGIEYELTIKQ